MRRTDDANKSFPYSFHYPGHVSGDTNSGRIGRMNYLRLDDVGTIERPGINGMETWREYVWAEPYFSFCTHLGDQTLVLQGQYGAFLEYVYGITLAEAGAVIDPNSDLLPGSLSILDSQMAALTISASRFRVGRQPISPILSHTVI